MPSNSQHLSKNSKTNPLNILLVILFVAGILTSVPFLVPYYFKHQHFQNYLSPDHLKFSARTSSLDLKDCLLELGKCEASLEKTIPIFNLNTQSQVAGTATNPFKIDFFGRNCFGQSCPYQVTGAFKANCTDGLPICSVAESIEVSIYINPTDQWYFWKPFLPYEGTKASKTWNIRKSSGVP